MKYMLLIYQGTAPTPLSPGWEKLSQDEQKAIYNDYRAVNETPGVTPGVGLQPAEAAKTVRVKGGKALATDGPYAETREALAGYLLYEAADLDAAVQLAARIPAARLGGAIEVRPIMEW